MSEALQTSKRCMATHPGSEMGIQDTIKLTGVKGRTSLVHSKIREDAVFKMTENAQPASGDQKAAAGSKGKEN